MDTRSLEHKLTPAEQWFGLKRHFTNVNGSFDRNKFQCRLVVRPTPLSQEYVLKIKFEKKTIESFEVFVLSPRPLKKATGQHKLPHVYNQNSQKLCLCLPRKKEWVPSMLLATSVVHWAIEWLYFYEIWLCTGEWLGGGEHPPRKDC
jgi:hypothetical protein